MFNPVQIKHECMGAEDVNSGDVINASNNSKYPTFIDEDVDYKYNQLPQFWGHAQLSNEVRPKTEIHGQHSLFQSEENNSLAYMRNCVQENALFQVNQEESSNQMNQHFHLDVNQKVEQSQFSPNVQPTKFTTQMVTISDPISSIKPSRLERPPKSSAESNIGKKLKCQCEICFKEFGHKSVKPYKCAVCGKEFRHSGNLSIHERIHSGIKPFQCKVCGKDFYHSGNLTTHMKKHSVNINTGVNQCENNDKQGICAAVNLNDTTSLNSFNNLPLTSTTDVKLMPGANNIVPIKNESNDEGLINTVGILTPTSI
ncbi:Zinc finger protein 37 [Anthophora quadrimaculata]